MAFLLGAKCPVSILMKDGYCSSEDAAAQRCALQRQGKPNAQLTVAEIDELCIPDAQGEALLDQAMTHMKEIVRSA